MKIAICSSMATQDLVDQMYEAGRQLAMMGYEPLLPPNAPSNDAAVDSIDAAKRKSAFFIEHMDKIRDSDAILVLNPSRKGIDGYIGGNTLCEMAVAFAYRKKIFVHYPLPDAKAFGYMAEIFAMQPVVLNGNLSQLKAVA